MGGAIGRGNVTPAAEFNIFFDARAASEVLSYGIPFVMVPLEVTRTVMGDENFMTKLREFQGDFGKKIYNTIEAYNVNSFNVNGTYSCLHDPCAVYYLLEKQDF
jgi:inosine-uridine nucleoside N-ribohydrolase